MPGDFSPSNPPEDEKNFAELFESYMADKKELRVGDRIEGEIISIGDKNLFVHTGTKTDGVAEKAEFTGKDGQFPYKAGDRIELYVVAVSEHEIRLSRSVSGAGGLSQLYTAFKSRIPVSGKVIETCKGGFQVQIQQQRAFCPVSQMDLKYAEEPETYVGQTFEFLITRITEGGRNIVVSRRELLKKQLAARQEKFIQTVKEGDLLDGRVVRIMPYGAFVELFPGIEGMVHISELSWSRIGRPEEAVKQKDVIRVKVLSIEPDKDKDLLRISLSAKQAAGDPWVNIHQAFKAGDKVTGTVTRCADFGAFVEIAPGIEGLVHISEMSYTRRVVRAEDVVSPGETAVVAIKEIDAEKRRISLSMKDAQGDPWAGVAQRYRVGQEVVGTIEKKEPFGFFIRLEPGITGLLPRSKIYDAPASGDIDKLKIDSLLSLVVEEVHPRDRKITLGIQGDRPDKDWRQYRTADSSGDMGVLEEKLRAALNRRKK